MPAAETDLPECAPPVQYPRGPPGDLYVVLQIAVPPANSEAVRKAYRELERALDFNPRAKLGV